MDVMIGYTILNQHVVRKFESEKCLKYQRFYQLQRLTFASIGYSHKFSLDENTPQFSAPNTLNKQQTIVKLRPKILQKMPKNYQVLLSHQRLWNYLIA